jgi:hypothetical protein
VLGDRELSRCRRSVQVKPAAGAFQHLNQRLGLGEATQMNQGFDGSGDE